MTILETLTLDADDTERAEHYDQVFASIDALLEGEDDWVSAMATVACELHHAFAYFHWTGFYREVEQELRIGPYQGGHGCLRIGWGKGVCGAAAASGQTQLVPDVHAFVGHIACASSTESELVVPVMVDGACVAVLDLDSDDPAAFREVDAARLEALCARLARQFFS